MPTKRAVAKAEAAKLVDLADRLAPFFPPPGRHVVADAGPRNPSEASS